jgi:hypothetical protein
MILVRGGIAVLLTGLWSEFLAERVLKRRGRKAYLFFFSFAEIVAQHPLLVFLIMAVDAEVFPVGAVGRIVVVVAVFVVNGEEVPVRIIKFTCTLGADKTVDAE